MELKTCSRCNSALQCQAYAIEKCACQTIKLSQATHTFLKNTFFDCLCNSCLVQIETQLQSIEPDTKELLEHIHYYVENGKLVFTEHYLLSRGYCCKSGCRHCPYGFVKNKDKK